MTLGGRPGVTPEDPPIFPKKILPHRPIQSSSPIPWLVIKPQNEAAGILLKKMASPM